MKTIIIYLVVLFLNRLEGSEEIAGTGDLRMKFIVDALLPKNINSGSINLVYEFGGNRGPYEDKKELSDCCLKIQPKINDNDLLPKENVKVTNYASCDDVPTSEGSGIYLIILRNVLKPVFCQIQNDSKYLVIQRRINGHENFYRSWSDYEEGFGNLTDEFWIGNWALSIITSRTPYKLLIELEAFDSTKVYALYESFSIGGPETKYKLNISGYSGTAGDSLTSHNGQKFTTFDQDNDNEASNCATLFKGAWWYDKCHASNLNGLYHQGNHSSYADGINWHSFRGHHESMKTVVMKILRYSP